MLPSQDVDRVEFASLYTLQYGLARDPEHAHGFPHGQEAIVDFAVEPTHEVVRQSDAPWGTWRQLLACDDAVVKQAMDGGRCDTEDGGGLVDGQQLAVRRVSLWLKAGNVPVAAQVADAACFEPMTISGGAILPIENAGDHGVGVMAGEPPDQRDGILVGADGGRS